MVSGDCVGDRRGLGRKKEQGVEEKVKGGNRSIPLLHQQRRRRAGGGLGTVILVGGMEWTNAVDHGG